MYAIADDLSGAAETAAALAGLRTGLARNAQSSLPRTLVSLELHSSEDAYSGGPLPVSAAADVSVVDSGNRHVPGAEASVRMRFLLASRPQGSSIFLKFDSLLRGNLNVELAAAAETGPVAFCPALPELGRAVRNGVLEIDGTPLHETDLWQAEPANPGPNIVARLSGASPTVVPLDVVRSGDLSDVLAAITFGGVLAVCDAETDSDLDLIAAAALNNGIVLAGASGLASAIRRKLPTPLQRPLPDTIVTQSSVMFILGTASSSTRAQLVELQLMGVPVHRVRPEAIHSFDPGLDGCMAVVVEGPVDPAQSAMIVQSLAGLARRSHGGRHLVLSGGETARSVLDALGIRRLQPLAQAHPGAVISVSDFGRLVATRPGSFGDRHSLTQIFTTIQALEAANPGKVSS